MIEPEQLAEIGQTISQLSTWMQRTYPRVTQPGAQCGEDACLGELLLEGDGTYVDVGASYPIECSNTWQFHERGWRGLLIEPLRDSWPALLRFRPGDILWPQAVSNYTGHAKLRICGTVSSLRSDWHIAEQGQAYCEVDTLANILARFPDIRDRCRLCSIDVEGLEKEVLEGIDWTTFHPEVFIVEWFIYGATAPDDDLSGTWRGILESQGYEEMHRTVLNLIFRRSIK